MRVFIAALFALFLAGCGSTPGVPDHTYFRMTKAQTLPVSESPVFNTPIVVNLIAADGLYADRALIYALDPSGAELRQYHYQLWTDPPTRALQRRLLIELRDSAIAPLVTDELAASQAAVRISGNILRLERVPTVDGGFIASVAMRLRVDRPDGTPQFDEIYHAEESASDKSLGSTVVAMSNAIDRIFTEFHADLLTSEAHEHAR